MLSALALLLTVHASPVPTAFGPSARGVVFHDYDRDGVRDPGERGLPGVLVSNGIEFARTDALGSYELPVTEDTILFLIKPRGWMTPVDKTQLPEFYYIHKPSGSPTLRYGGVQPTGPLPSSVDFALYPHDEPLKFRALFFGDTQSRDLRELGYLTQSLITKIDRGDAKFGVTLGDILFDDLSIFQQHNEAIALIGIPWYNVLGNHDINYDAQSDELSDETFEKFYGPSYYSFDYGKVHFVVLDDVWWMPADKRYKAAIGTTQLEWLKRDLSYVKEDNLVVLMMHIPLNEVVEKKEILALLSRRPYSLSVAAHTHFQEHRFFGKDDGFDRSEPHHHVVNVTTCGSWWSGAPNELGIPHSTMRDGAPRGYSVFTFDGTSYSIEYRAAGSEASYQMNIYAPEALPAAKVEGTPILVNVFGGSAKSYVEMRLGSDGPWRPLRRVALQDPAYAKTFRFEKNAAPYRQLPAPIDSPHIWRGVLPQTSLRGYQPIHVRTRDMFGQTYIATQGIRIE